MYTERERYRESSESLVNKSPLNVSWCFSFAYLLASAPTYTASLLASLHSSTIRPQIIIGEARVARQGANGRGEGGTLEYDCVCWTQSG